MWQEIIGKWQTCTSAIMQSYIVYSDNVILYMIIRKTIQYENAYLNRIYVTYIKCK